MKTIWYNGSVITMDPAVSGSAVLCEDGRILAVGEQDALLHAHPDALRKDLQGHALLPGFIDPHSHFSQVASSLLQADLDGVDSCDEIGRRLMQFAEKHHADAETWIIAKNYDTNLMPGQKDPDLAQIDAWLNCPLIVQQKSGHMGLFNSKALAFLGITADTPDPKGGKIGRAYGKLTGYLEENAYFDAMKKAPMASMETLLQAFREAQDLYASYGITTLQDGMLVSQMLPIYQLLIRSHIMKLDLVAYPDHATYEAAKAEFPDHQHAYSDHIRMGGIKIFLDGSPQGRTAWMRTPYAGEKDYCGYGTLKDEEVLAAAEAAARNHTQLLAHCNGDAASAQYIRCVQKAETEYPELAQLRPVIIHAQLLGLDQIPQAKELGMIASFFVAHVYHWGDVHIRNFGLERASKISPAASALAAGLPFTFHQDSPVIAPDMMETLWCAVNRRTKNDVLLGAEERISIEDALKAVTINAAWQYSEEAEKGSITPGKKADFVILEQNPLTVNADDIRKIQVMETIKGGASVYQH